MKNTPTRNSSPTTDGGSNPIRWGIVRAAATRAPATTIPERSKARKAFMRQAILHFRDRKESVSGTSGTTGTFVPARDAQLDRLVCYCDHCRAEFIGWLQRKYRDIETLDRIWGRCYNDWEEVELPRNTETIKDFIDWRLFHNYTMTREAQWRLEMVRELAPEQAAYLHVVPNTMQPFNAVSTCTDDFAVAEMCDVFAATMNNGPFFTPQVLSAGRGKICYNVESHINGGGITTHQAMLGMDDLLHDFIPQIGLGIKGFLFWQYRPEVLGIEAPAWGLTQLDGTDREITRAASRFVRTLAPVSDKLMRSFPQAPQIGIWKSAGNEIFHYCMFRNFDGLAAGVNAYAEYCYRNSYGYRFVNSEGLERLDGIRVLILPDCYYLSQREAEAIDAWVRKGGTLLVEAHAGGYNDDTGRHSRTMPGLGLDDKWNLREKNTASTFRLKLDTQEEVNVRLSEDAAKALRDFGVSGDLTSPSRCETETSSGERCATPNWTRRDADTLGAFRPGTACIVRKKIGGGTCITAEPTSAKAVSKIGRLSTRCSAKCCAPGMPRRRWTSGEAFAPMRCTNRGV